jgi:hypothetical protein
VEADALEAARLEVDFSPSDTDAEEALEILRGAHRGPHDPDIALGTVLTNLRDATPDEVRSALARLISDANSV